MNNAPVRFAILGFGHHAIRRLLPAFAQTEHATVSGIWRRDQALSAQNCQQHAIQHCFASREELCSSPDVDVVFITSPDAMHLDDALLAIEHGKAVLCEKPLAMNAAEARTMAEAANAVDVLFGVGQNFRFNRSVEYLREQVAAGVIGQPQIAHAQYAYAANLAPRRWIADPSLACGGPIADVGVHCIDTLRYILDADVTSVSTLAAKDEAAGPMESKVEAMASMQLQMTRDVLANVTVSARAPYRTLLEIVGSDGALIAENGLTVDREVEVVLRRGGELLDVQKLDNGDGYVRMIDSFVAAYRGTGHFAATVEGSVENMRVLDAAYKSWKSGQRELVV